MVNVELSEELRKPRTSNRCVSLFPPHFHAEYAEFKATVDIRNLRVLEGELPRRALDLVLDWAELHREELLNDWNLCRAKEVPRPIAPLL